VFLFRERRITSGILCAVRNSNFSLTLALVTAFAGFLFVAQAIPAAAQQEEQQSNPTPTVQQPPPVQVAPPPSPPNGPVIVLDPAHGGTDTGARGENGLAEKDIVLQIARAIREQLARDGDRVVLTRNDDSNPSYDDRAATANAFRDAIFISIHVSSTGTPGTVRAYYDQFAAPVPSAATATVGSKPVATETNGLIAWDEAQRPHVDASHRLADLIQSDLAQSFSGSPSVSIAAPVRTLRSVNAPAVAIEISSVSGSTPDSLTAGAGPLATAISEGLKKFRQSNSAEAR